MAQTLESRSPRHNPRGPASQRNRAVRPVRPSRCAPCPAMRPKPLRRPSRRHGAGRPELAFVAYHAHFEDFSARWPSLSIVFGDKARDHGAGRQSLALRRSRHALLQLSANTGERGRGDMLIGASAEQFDRSHASLRFPVRAGQRLVKRPRAAFRGRPFHQTERHRERQDDTNEGRHGQITMP